MTETIDLGTGVQAVIRKHHRAKRMRLALRGDGSIFLTLPPSVSFKKGRVFLASKLDWIREKTKLLSDAPERLLSRGSEAEYRSNREATLRAIAPRLAFFQERYGVVPRRISIRNQKTRWGSCSRQGNLSFNYRLLFLAPHLRDYVIVHELCHLLQFDHSPHFWALVGRSFPDYRALRRELRLL